jgi:hypothetical protein
MRHCDASPLTCPHDQITQAQVIRDEIVRKLIDEMDEACKSAMEAKSLRKGSERTNEIVIQILRQVMECTFFVKGYCSVRPFGLCSENTTVERSI